MYQEGPLMVPPYTLWTCGQSSSLVPSTVMLIFNVMNCQLTSSCFQSLFVQINISVLKKKALEVWTLWLWFWKIWKNRESEREKGREQWEKTTQVWQAGICALVCVHYMCVLALGEWRSPWMALAPVWMCMHPCRYLWSVCDGAYRLHPPPSAREGKTSC